MGKNCRNVIIYFKNVSINIFKNSAFSANYVNFEALERPLNINAAPRNFTHIIFIPKGNFLGGETKDFQKKCFFEPP